MPETVTNPPVSRGRRFHHLITLAAMLLVGGPAFGDYQLGKNQILATFRFL